MSDPSTSFTDVLIIGAGPSGLMAAYWMARLGVKARIIDKRGTKVFTGQADGLRPRTMELFDSMNVLHRVLHEACEASEFAFWGPDESGNLKQQARNQINDMARSPYGNALLNQGRIERFILDAIKQHSDIEVERGVIADSLKYDEDIENHDDEYPVTVTLRTLSEEEANPTLAYGGAGGAAGVENGLFRSNVTPDDWDDLVRKSRERPGNVETVKAKYLIGCDGAHSWTRKQLNIPFEGNTTEHIWGVVDIYPITDFPDIRCISTVETEFGTILVIPREKQLVRLYIPLHDVNNTSETFDRSSVTLDMIRETAKKLFGSFSFDFKVCEWWTVYQTGQRLAPTFSKGRIHLAGDAIHTHSPKAGLGMNMSMQDGFNLGWKIALVAKGIAHPRIIDTYQLERKKTAQMLIELDRRLQPLFMKQQEDGPKASLPDETIANVMNLTMSFANGYICYYGASPLVHKGGEKIATNLVPGERFLPAKLRNQVEGRAWWTTRLFEADGKFRILLLAGDMLNEEQRQRVSTFSTYLGSAESVMRRFTPKGQKLNSVVDVLTIHSNRLDALQFSEFPETLRLYDEQKGWAYDQIWSDSECPWDRNCQGTAYDAWGVDRVRGALVILRPDQHVGWVGNIEDVEEMTSYFEGVLRRPNDVAETATDQQQ